MSVLDLGAAAGSRIGRYFGLVSALPSAVLVLFGFVLHTSDAWNGPPDWARAGKALAHLGLGTAAMLSLVSVFLGLVLHPLQYALVQLYEGYWGSADATRRAAFARSMRYWRRYWRENERGTSLERAVGAAAPADLETANWLRAAQTETDRVRNSFPDTPGAFMPTRLGNILRRYEELAGAPFGLQAIDVIPQLTLVAPDKDNEYLSDQRSALDLAVRMSVTSLLATGLATVFLWRDGLWLLIALLPYSLAYVLYRGAVVTAHEYGTAMAALIALNRYALYERLGLPKPTSTYEERENNERLKGMYTFGSYTELSPPTKKQGRWKRTLQNLLDRGHPK